MAQKTNDEASVGRRIGRLIQQIDLRIARAEYTAKLYAEERGKASALGNGYKAMKASIARNVWEVYANNLREHRNGLMKAVREALVCYNDREKRIWWLYFVERKSCYEIEDELGLNARNVQRCVAGMKDDMELRFSLRLPNIGDRSSPKWGADALATFLRDKPSEDYRAAIRDLVASGFADLDALEFDQDFQAHVADLDAQGSESE